jgi:RNA polymerase sigma factor (sigma-70 family)
LAQKSRNREVKRRQTYVTLSRSDKAQKPFCAAISGVRASEPLWLTLFSRAGLFSRAINALSPQMPKSDLEPLQVSAKRHFLSEIERAHSGELRRFLATRLRNRADVSDLIQEVYLRLLRLRDHEAIRNPQAYLYTIARHVLHQHALRRAVAPDTMDPLQVVNALHANVANDPAEEVDIERRVEALGRSLASESPRAYAVLVMYRCEGMTLKQIGERLGISSVMARKYLMRAIKYCDQRLAGDE